MKEQTHSESASASDVSDVADRGQQASRRAEVEQAAAGSSELRKRDKDQQKNLARRATARRGRTRPRESSELGMGPAKAEGAKAARPRAREAKVSMLRGKMLGEGGGRESKEGEGESREGWEKVNGKE